jgi:hypothetical protein
VAARLEDTRRIIIDRVDDVGVVAVVNASTSTVGWVTSDVVSYSFIRVARVAIVMVAVGGRGLAAPVVALLV